MNDYLNEETKHSGKLQLYLNIILLTSGSFISTFGTRIYEFAIAFYVLEFTGSPVAFSLTLVLGTIPRILISPIAGSIADRFQRKKVVITMDIVRGVILILFYFAVFKSGIKINYIYVSIFLLSIMDIFFNIAYDAATPSIVDKNNLTRVNSLKQTINSIGKILAPSLGGIIIYFVDVRYFILLNSLSFFISAIAISFINFNYYKNQSNGNNKLEKNISIKNIFIEMQDGFKYLKSKIILVLISIYSMLGNFVLALGYAVPIPFIIVNVLKFSSRQYGLITASLSLGSIVTSIVLSILPQPKKRFKSFLFASITLGMALLFLGVLSTPLFYDINKQTILVLLMITGFLFGGSTVMINIPTTVVQQQNTDANYLGRVLGFQSTLSGAITPLAFILSGKLLAIIPPYVIPTISGILFIVVTVILIQNKELQNI